MRRAGNNIYSLPSSASPSRLTVGKAAREVQQKSSVRLRHSGRQPLELLKEEVLCSGFLPCAVAWGHVGLSCGTFCLTEELIKRNIQGRGEPPQSIERWYPVTVLYPGDVGPEHATNPFDVSLRETFLLTQLSNPMTDGHLILPAKAQRSVPVFLRIVRANSAKVHAVD